MTDNLEHQIASAWQRFDALNAMDPQQIVVDGERVPRELALARWLTEWVYRVVSSPSVPLVLASRCQHLQRFNTPRSDYPEGRLGYLKWRKDLSKRHADSAPEVLASVGFDPPTIEQVRRINLKQDIKNDPDCQAMEDALCLSFLEHEYAEFSAKHPDEKVVEIVQKTWRKMSPQGHELALALPLAGRPQQLVLQALGA